MMRPIVIGLDPGFASFGWAALRLGAESPEDHLLGLGVIRTQKSAAKRRVRSTDDNAERASEIADALLDVLARYDHVDCARVIAFCVEQMSFVRSSAVMAKVGMAHGIAITIATQGRYPLLGVTPQELKRGVCGMRDASKEQIRDSLRARYLTCQALDALDREVPRGQQEHPYDALGAIVACLETDTIRMGRQLARSTPATGGGLVDG